MNPVNRLGLGAVVITALIGLSSWAIYWGIAQWREQSSQNPSESRMADFGAVQSDAEVDSDSDGLPDKFEVLYRTDSNSADSDGDGTTDLAEISSGRDPALPGPNDESRVPTGDQVINQNTYTARYLAQLPGDIERSQILDRERLASFVDANKGVLLPEISDEILTVSEASGKDAVQAYLDSISASHNNKLHVVSSDDIDRAFRALLNDPRQLETILVHLRANVDALKGTVAPREVTELHRSYVSASQALLDATHLLAGMRDDFVGGLIGAKKIEDLSPIFAQIAKEVQILEEKYGIAS